MWDLYFLAGLLCVSCQLCICYSERRGVLALKSTIRRNWRRRGTNKDLAKNIDGDSPRFARSLFLDMNTLFGGKNVVCPKRLKKKVFLHTYYIHTLFKYVTCNYNNFKFIFFLYLVTLLELAWLMWCSGIYGNYVKAIRLKRTKLWISLISSRHSGSVDTAKAYVIIESMFMCITRTSKVLRTLTWHSTKLIFKVKTTNLSRSVVRYAISRYISNNWLHTYNGQFD